MSLTSLDLNADLGEMPDDYIQLLSVVTSANLACGGHAGGGQLLKDTVAAAVKNNVQVGAHPSYVDRENFGRVSLKENINKEDLVKQILLVKREIESHGRKLSHIKAHGALYNDAMVNREVSLVLVAAVRDAAPNTPILGLPNSVLEQVCKEQGIEYIPEGFVDRAFTSQGQLLPRSEPGAVLDHEQSLEQVLSIATNQKVITHNGEEIPLNVKTICVHADTPNAFQTALEVKNLLLANGIQVNPFSAEKL